MNRHRNSVLSSVAPLVAGCLVAGCAWTQREHARADYTKGRAQIEQRLQEIFRAAETKEFGRLDSYHRYGPEFTKFTDSSPERLDASAARTGEHLGLAATQNLKMRAEDLKIEVFGRVGIATFILHYGFERAGEDIHRRERSTMVFVLDGESWKIVHEHLSSINP